MRVRFLNLHYWPESKSTGQHLTDLAEHLAAGGHDVRVLTGMPPAEEGSRAPRRGVQNGVQVERLGRGRARRGLRGQLLDYLEFHLAVALRVLFAPRNEILVSLTTPPLLGFWCALARRLRGLEHVVFVMDHHPDAEFEAGLVRRSSWLGRLLEATYGWILRSATRVVVLGRYQGERALARRMDPERLVRIPIWSRAEEIPVLPREGNPLRARWGWDGRFVVLYSGNAGQVHRFDELLEAMACLEATCPRVLFAFVGGGARWAEIQRFAEERSLRNIEFHGGVPREELGALLCAADVHFVSLREEQAGVAVPGKLYGQLASGRPSVFVGPRRCETAEDLLAAGAGQVFAPGEEMALAAYLESLAGDPAACAAMGSAGRAWFLEKRERQASCEAWRGLLEAVAAGDPALRTVAQGGA